MTSSGFRIQRFLRALVLAIAGPLMLWTGTLSAQTSTATVRGIITGEGGAPLAEAQVTARNTASGVQRGTVSREDGGYTLPGLIPGNYELTVRRIGTTAQTRAIVLQIGTTQTQNFSMTVQAQQLSSVVVVAAPAAIETRTSEVGTNITPDQIEKLPTSSRNFLDLAALAPGITVAEEKLNGTGFRTFSSGGQPPNAVNLFVDGTSLKNDLTGGGVSGQDASRGNPFPRNAIQEYRVITQNFKAEYQKASAAIITATTKSGGNEWSGDALIGYQTKGFVSLDSFQRRDKNNSPSTFRKPDYKRTLAAVSVGGPLIKDKMHFFGSYEGNYQDRANRVNFAPPPSGFPALDTVNITQYNGNFGSPFRETLLFGKVNYAATERSSLEVNFSHRHETDIRDFDNNTAFPGAVDFRQNVSIAQAKYSIFAGDWVNEAKVDYSRFQRNPRPSILGLPQRVYNYGGNDYEIGGNRSTQDFVQGRVGLRNDLTYSGLEWSGEHVIKGGASIDFLKYDIVKDNDGTPRFLYGDVRNGQTYNYGSPFELTYGTGNPNINKNNAQVGLYIQDDWSPMERLTFNIGVRWDYESKMLNYDYKTPQNVIDTVTRYNNNFPAPLDLDRFISTGSERKPFYGAIQPRLGFSYAIDKDSKTTIFGGWGIYYDRALFDIAVDETLKLTHPTYTIRFAPRGVTPLAGQVAWNDSYLTADRSVLDALVGTFGRPEAWLIDRDVKVPKSKQFSAGVRQLIGDFAVSATYAGVRGEDYLTMNWAQFGLNPNGTCCVSFDIGAHGFSNIIYSSNDAKTWYDALHLTADRPYQRAAANEVGWGAGLAYTYAVRSLQGVDALGDLFAFPNTANIPKHPSNDEKHRIVGNWIVDMPWVFGIQFSGLATLGGKFRKDVSCPPRFCATTYERGGFTVPGTLPYRRVDLRLRKDFPSIGRTTTGLTLDVYNALNRDNFTDYETGDRNNANFGRPTAVSDARRFQIGAEINWR
jgi:outer membrane receptor protein involved in Fe transport